MHILTPGRKQARRRSGASTRQEKPAHQFSWVPLFKILLVALVTAVGGLAAMETPKVVETVSKQRVEQVIIGMIPTSPAYAACSKRCRGWTGQACAGCGREVCW